MAFWNRKAPAASALDVLEAAEERSLDIFDVWGEAGHHSGLDGTLTGRHISTARALQMVAVWACVSIVADNVSTMPLELFHLGKQSAPLPDQPWMSQPNPEHTAVDFWHRVVSSLLLDGNAFVYYELNASGGFSNLIPIHPEQVQVLKDPNTGKIVFWIFGQPFFADKIIHVKAFTLAGWLRGLSPIEYARMAIGLGLTAEEFGARYYDQGVTMSGVVETTKDLTKEQAQILAKTFSAAHQGVHKSHLPGVLTAGATWKPISITPEAAQFLETRRFQKQEIAALYRVPAYLLDPSVTSSWGTGIQEQNRAFVQFTLMPWLTRIEQAFSAVMQPRALKVKFNVAGLLRGDVKDRYFAYKIGIDSGFLTVNEVRAMENLDPIAEPIVKPPAAVVPPATPTDTDPNSPDVAPTPAKDSVK